MNRTLGLKMAREIWVGPNRRALGFGMVLPALVMALGLWLTIKGGMGWRVAGTATCIFAAVVFWLLMREWFRPRVAYHSGHVEFYLRAGEPDAVPVEFVEAFFLGHGSAMLPAKKHSNAESVTLVARLSRRAEEWAHVEVKPQLGKWCDGYVTIRGTWCEPLTVKLVERLNRSLYGAERDNSPENTS
jgi:hypothetical protein